MSTDDRLSIEDRVRIATRARASLVRDIRPLPAPGLSYLRHRRAPRASRWLTWGVPLAAAAAVVAVALSLAAVRHDNTMPVKPAVPAGGPQGIPRYFVAIKMAGINGSRALIVGDDQTGSVIATVFAPRGVIFGGPHFGGVTDAGDDRTFVVTAENDHVYTFYLLRIAPGSARPYRLTRLPIAPVFNISSAPVLSPDGSKLAVLATRLSIFSVKSGKALRTWSGDTLHASNVSWEPDGRRVVFYAWNSGIRTLDVTTHATDILAASRLLRAIPPSDTCASAHLAPDGKTVICVTEWGVQSPRPGGATEAPVCASANGLRFLAYSVRVRQAARVLYWDEDHCHPALADVLWMDASASRVIGALMFPTNSPDLELLTVGRLGLITQAGGFQPIKLPKAVTAQDYPYMAF